MKLRIISDLHVDINHNYYSKFKFDPDAFYLIAGDVSGSRIKTEKFIKHAMERGLKQGIFIEGNHMGYDIEFNQYDHTKEACYAYLAEKFPLTSNVSFMENDFKEISDDIIVVGCTLYTDFMAFNNREYCMGLAKNGMNDFRYVLTYDESGEDVRLVTPLDYEKRFKESLQFIEEVCKSNPTHRIIVVTHHGPSKKSLSSEYVHDALSAAYVSDLEDFINNHPNIRLWCHGHVHRPFKYTIGKCDVVCSPFGYYNENSMKLTRYIGEVYDTNWNP